MLIISKLLFVKNMHLWNSHGCKSYFTIIPFLFIFNLSNFIFINPLSFPKILLGLQEEKAELKAQYYLLDKEKKTLELKLSSREAQEQAYRVQIDHLKSEVKDSLSSPWEEQPSSLGRHRIDVMMRNGKV